jgi:hypothetical protein
MTPVDPASPEFDELVADALEHLWDLAYLGKHALTELQSVKRRVSWPSDLTLRDQGRALGDLLQVAIVKPRPPKTQHNFSREKLLHTILYQAYVEGIENKQIAKSLNIGERTYYRYKAVAIHVVALLLRYWEE